MLQCHRISVVSDLIILNEWSQLPDTAIVVYRDDIQSRGMTGAGGLKPDNAPPSQLKSFARSLEVGSISCGNNIE